MEPARWGGHRLSSSVGPDTTPFRTCPGARGRPPGVGGTRGKPPQTAREGDRWDDRTGCGHPKKVVIRFIVVSLCLFRSRGGVKTTRDEIGRARVRKRFFLSIHGRRACTRDTRRFPRGGLLTHRRNAQPPPARLPARGNGAPQTLFYFFMGCGVVRTCASES